MNENVRYLGKIECFGACRMVLVNDCSIVTSAAIAIEMKVSLRAFLFLHDFGMVMGRMSTILWYDTVTGNSFGTGIFFHENVLLSA